MNIWAAVFDSPITVCRDARRADNLHSGDARFAGQSGWDWGINFGSFQDLLTQIIWSGVDDSRSPRGAPAFTCGNWVDDCEVRYNSVDRLALNCHGMPGSFYVDGLTHPPLTVANARSRDFHGKLLVLGGRMRVGGHFFLMGCLAGQGAAGSDFLVELSNIMGGVRVVGFTTTGVAIGGQMLRQGQQCSEPGMRDSPNPSAPVNGSRRIDDPSNNWSVMWDDFSRLPWASETSPHAKIALDGAIIQGAGT